MSRGTRLQKYFNEDSTVVVCMKPNGDCFYCAVSQALACDNTQVSVGALRNIIASFASKDLLDMYKSYYAAQVEGYQFMKNVHSLSQLQDVLKIKGTERGTCIWADDYAIQQISNFYNVTFLIINESSRSSSQNIINPTKLNNNNNNNNNNNGQRDENNNEATETAHEPPNNTETSTNDHFQGASSSSSPFPSSCSFSPSSSSSSSSSTAISSNLSTDELPTQKFIVLQLTRHMHYNLVGFKSNDKRNEDIFLFTKATLPHSFASKFGIETSATSKKRDLRSFLDGPVHKRKK